jgi:hypothetical protein
MYIIRPILYKYCALQTAEEMLLCRIPGYFKARDFTARSEFMWPG